MITKEITLCEQPVTLGYCYATEIAYKDIAEEDMMEYAKHAIESIQAQRDPDIKRTIFAILACMMAFSHANNQEPTITDVQLMNEAKPMEIGLAIFAILEMRQQFYHVPAGEPKPKKGKGRAPKNPQPPTTI